MFDLGFSEVLVVFVIALVVLGPEKLPSFTRMLTGLVQKLRGLNHRFQEELTQYPAAAELEELAQDLKKGARALSNEVTKGYLTHQAVESQSALTPTPLQSETNSAPTAFVGNFPYKSSLHRDYRRNQRSRYQQKLSRKAYSLRRPHSPFLHE
ncbi:MAG: Sec-independent protein translocase protein TatB [Neisseriaceae bacterium]